MINQTINSFFTCPLAYIHASHQPDENNVTIVSQYIGSNGYTVSIEVSLISYKIKAKIISPNDASFETMVENICNGLDNKPLTVEQIMGMIQSGPHAFKAIYLPETNKVYVWAHMKAAGEGNLFMNNDAHNPFIGTCLRLLRETLRNENFKIPGTSKTVAEVGGFEYGKDNKTFIAKDNSVTVHYDTGIRNRNPKNGQNHKNEPIHVGVKIWTKGATEQVKINYPTNPRDPRWKSVVKEQNQVPIDENPTYDPVFIRRKPDGGGSGPKGGGGRGGNGGRNGGNPRSDGSGVRSPGSAPRKSGAGAGSMAALQHNLNKNGLISSYNSTNRNQPLLKTSHQQQIGGVAVANPNAILLNLNSSLYDLTADGYWITFPFLAKRIPFSNEWLQQIIRELAQNVYIHNTFPFYSLHFTKEGSLYSVIHPGYQNTLVGKVIGMIDYFMKGYLNGGYFNEPDLIRFAGDKFSWMQDVDQLKPSIRPMETLYKKTFQDGSEYMPLIQLLEQFHIKQSDLKLDKAILDRIQQRFQISFRIIAKQEQIEKHDSTLLFRGGMDVLYTIECHRDAIDQVEKYQASDEYKTIKTFCDYVASDIKTRLAQLLPCRDYFKMLDVICALSYYFSSLKRQEMAPKLLPVKADAQQICPGLFPPYPKTQLERKETSVTLWDVIQGLDVESATLFEEFLLQEDPRITPPLQTALAHAIQKLLPKETLKLSATNLDDLILQVINTVLKKVSELKKDLFSAEGDQQRQILEALQVIAEEDVEKLEAMRWSLREQYNAVLDQIADEEKDDIAQKKREIEQLINQKCLENEHISIPYDHVRVFEGWRYESAEALKLAMHRSLVKKGKQVLQQITLEIQAHGRNQRKQAEAVYQQKLKELNGDIAKADSIWGDILAERIETDTMRQSIHTHPSHQTIAQSIPLGISAIVKKPPTLDSTDDGTPLVRIHGGTGFKLEDQAILLNTALVTSLSQQLEAHSARISRKAPGEEWKAVTINQQSYQAFYIRHASLLDHSALEQSLIKPSTASTARERQWIQLATQNPTTAAQLDEVTEFIADNKTLNLNITDAYGNTALHLAAMNDNLAFAELLLKHGVKSDALNQFGNSPVHVASMYGHDKIIKAIHQANKNSLHQLTMNDESALHLAVLHHRLETVQLLISYGFDVNEVGINGVPIIYTALYNHSYEISDYLLSKPYIDVHFRLENGNTLLHLAVLVHAQELIPTLLSKKVDIHVQNRDGKTPLHIAVELGYLDIVKQLLGPRNSALEQLDSADNTPLYLAIQHRQEAVCDYLLEIGAKTDQLIDGGNALTHALKTGQVRVAKTILKANQFKLNTQGPIDKDNFLWMCKLGVWQLCEPIIARNPQWATQTLDKDHAELSCYIDYVYKHNRITQWSHVLGNFKTGTVAYLKAHVGKLYKLAIKHRSHAILQPMLQVVDPYPPYRKLFKNDGLKNDKFASYSDYDLIQFAVRYDLPQFYGPYVAGVRNPAALEHATADGKSLLYLAAESGNRELIEMLLDKQALLDKQIHPIAPNGQHIFYALIEHNHPDIIRSLLLDERYRSFLNINGLVSKTEQIRAIDLACKLGNLKMATSLIQWGAKIDKPNPHKKLPIYYAIENNAPHLIRLIFRYEIGDVEKILNYAIRLHKNAIFLQLLKHRPALKAEILACANSLLVTAIDHHNVGAYKRLISLGATVNNALLHEAITHNAHEIVPLLIAAGCDRQAIEKGQTPLERASELNHDLCVHALLQGGPLSQERSVKASKWIELIVTGEAAVVNQEFIEAIKCDDLDKVKELTTHYAPVNLQYLFEGEKINCSLLDIAILEVKPKIIQYLLNNRCCDPHASNSLDLSAVHLLMRRSDAHFVIQLIKQFNEQVDVQFKLDINRADPRNGCTPLHMALLCQNQAMANYLMENGADMYAEMTDGKTVGKNVLQIAIEQKNLAFIKLAIGEYAYNLHYKNSLQECALAMALKAGNVEVAQYLVESGADIQGISGFKQRTMLHYAVLSHDAKIVFYVLSCGVQTRVQDHIGMLPVHLAAKQGDLEIVDLLDDIEKREVQEGTLVALTDLRNRDVRDFALIHRRTELSAHLTQKHGLPLRNTLTSSEQIRFKTYKQGGKTPLELAILAEDQTTVAELIDQVAANDTFHIKRALTAASTSQNVALFSYVIDRLWDGTNQQLLLDCLEYAIASNCTENVKQLLSRIGEDRQNLLFGDGSTPLVLACAAKAHDVLKELLAHITPSHPEIYAAFLPLIQHDQLVMAKRLYACDEAKAAIHATDSNGETLLHHAVKHNRPNMVAFFILCGCVDKKNYGGKTALSQALLANQTECIQYLTTAYPPGVTAGQSLLHYIAREQRLDYAMLNWLCRFQDINAQDQAGQTALHYAMQRQDFQAVEILLAHQADVTLTNQHNQDALELAFADTWMFAILANSINLPQVTWSVANSHRNNRISVIKKLLSSTNKDHNYLYELLTSVVNTGSVANAKQCIVLYQRLYPDAPSLLELAYQAYRRSEEPEQATHARVLSWLLENHSNPYTAFNSKLAEIKTEPRLGKIYRDWYDKQWETLTQHLNQNLQFNEIDDVLEMLNTLMPQIEASCEQTKTYDDASWVLLFLFFERVITAPVSNMTPKALITAIQSAATLPRQALIRKVVEQPYLQDLMTSQVSLRSSFDTFMTSQAALRSSVDKCVIL